MMAVIDSGLGGLSVVRALRERAPGLPLIYVADTAAFPYGNRSAADITARAIALAHALQSSYALSHIVLACNTLSTLSLAALRTAFPNLAFVGTVPAVKVAAEQSRTRRFTLLATPNTAHSAYSNELIARFAADCVVDCYGAPNLARLCEASLLGEPVSDAAWIEQIAPCFFDDALGRTDQIILGCTHYPLVVHHLRKHAMWEVNWVDSSDAIARHTLANYRLPGPSASLAYVTSPADLTHYTPVFMAEGFDHTDVLTPSRLQQIG
jgi:glutamate racemase